jgi:hypothetical protein
MFHVFFASLCFYISTLTSCYRKLLVSILRDFINAIQVFFHPHLTLQVNLYLADLQKNFDLIMIPLVGGFV